MQQIDHTMTAQNKGRRNLWYALVFIGLLRFPVLAQKTGDINRAFQIPMLSKEVRYVFEKLDLPGMAVVVMKDGKVLHDRALGYANLDTGEQLTTDHLFWTASVTKSFTAATLLKLEAEGEIDLNTPIIAFGVDRYFLPARTNDAITLRHIITQTSEGKVPGKNFVYSFRYNWLIAPFDGQKGFERTLKAKLLDGLEIDGLVASYQDIMNDSVSVVMPHRFEERNQIFRPSPQDRWETVIPATNLLASPKGLAQAGQALNDGIGLPAHLSILLNGNLVDDGIDDDSYGYGCFVSHIYGKRILWQYGYGGAESALFIRVPEDSLSISVLCNAATLSGATRLGSGDFQKHPLADAILRYVILADQNLPPTPNWKGSIKEIEARLRTRIPDVQELDANALITQALLEQLKPIPNKIRSGELLGLAMKLYPEELSKESEPALWLMTQHAEKKYIPFVQAQLEQALERNPKHPWFLGLAADFFMAVDNEKKALSYWRQNANNIYYREQSQISDACLSLALRLETSDSKKALKLAWRALEMSSWSFSWNRNQEARDLLSRILSP